MTAPSQPTPPTEVHAVGVAEAGAGGLLRQPGSVRTSSTALTVATRARVGQLGAVILLLAAAVVWFGMAPEAPDPASSISVIESTDDANNANASGAPQQAVVNGWTTIDYLRLLAQQSDAASARQDRSTAMLGLCVAGIAILTLTVSRGPAERLDARVGAESAGITDPVPTSSTTSS